MPQISTSYSEAAAVEAVRTYDQFLTKLYIQAAAIKDLPPEG